MSTYPNTARLTDIVQEAGLKRSGLVASCLFPEVEVPACAFEWIDWKQTYADLKLTDDTVGCYSQPHRIDPGSFVYLNGKTKEHALDMVLKECCVSACTTDGRLPFNIDAKKTQQLVDRMLLNREISAVAKATQESAYTAGNNTNLLNGSEASDGKIYTFARATIFADTYDILGLFQAIQNQAALGAHNTMVIDRVTMTAMLRHAKFKPGGCAVPVMAAEDEIAALLGLDKVCIADSRYNTATPGSPISLSRIWGSYIWLGKSYGLVTPDEATRTFGFSAYTKDLTNRVYFDNTIGSDGGNVQVVSHDLTEVVADIQAATLIKLT